jgi:predicted transport protein
VIASLEASGEKIVDYDYQVETKYSTGLTANKDAARFQAVKVQSQRIAVELTNRLEEDRDKIESKSAPAQSQR